MQRTLLLLAAVAAAPLAAQTAPDPSWVQRAAIYQVFVRDFSPSGNFRGLIAGLDRIEASGANTIWLMPIHPIGRKDRKGTLGSPYAATDHGAINPDFGTPADFRALIREAHSRGMRVILDFVPNHTAADARWLREQPDFFVRDSAGRPVTPRNEKGEPTDWTDVIQLDYRNPLLRAEMIATMRRWIVEYNVDGFRMDVAGFVPGDFWTDAIRELRGSVARPILLLAEWGDHRMHGYGFDLTYGWDAYKRLKAVWAGDSAVAYVRHEIADLDSMPPAAGRLRFTTNHDETAWDKPPMAIFGDSIGARAAFVAAALLPGRPMLYNGQEVESPVVLRLFEQDTIAWQRPQGEAARPFYRTVMELARFHPAFQGRDVQLVQTTAPKDVIAFRRRNVLVLVNSRPRPVVFRVEGHPVGGSYDLLGGMPRAAGDVRLGPHGILVLELAR
jgi:1,4-alpha-glucan branching enzyme